MTRKPFVENPLMPAWCDKCKRKFKSRRLSYPVCGKCYNKSRWYIAPHEPAIEKGLHS